jgi:hypothetical protein
MEGFWPLWRSWLHPHWGISQEKLPLYLGFFEFVHGFDHGVGHPLLLLRDAKAPPCQKNKAFKDLGHYPEWPKVADAVIEALFTMPESEAKPCLVHSLR